MKAKWSKIPLGQLCKVQSGSSNTQDAVPDGQYAFFDRSKTPKRSDRYLFDCEALIIAGEGAEFRPKKFNGKFDLHQRAYAIHGFGDQLLGDYLFYYLEHVHEYFQRVAVGATVKSLRQRHFDDLPVIVPPLEEQRQIVAVLEEVFAAIAGATANAEKNLADARAAFEAYSHAMFATKYPNWSERTLSEVCEKITDGTHQTPTYFDDGYVFLSSKNVKDRRIDWTNVKYVDEVQHLAMQKRLNPRRGDILLAKNGTTGVAAMVDRDTVFDIYVSLALLRPLDGLIPEYLLHFVNSPVAKLQFNSRLKGSGVPNLHLKEIREVAIQFPKSKAEQLDVVRKLDQMDMETRELADIFCRKLGALDRLKQSLLQQAFAGKLSAIEIESIAA